MRICKTCKQVYNRSGRTQYCSNACKHKDVGAKKELEKLSVQKELLGERMIVAEMERLAFLEELKLEALPPHELYIQ